MRFSFQTFPPLLLVAWAIILFSLIILVVAQQQSVLYDHGVTTLAHAPTLRKLSLGTAARCLDGTSPAYYIRKGSGNGREKWVVFFEGGGWCMDLEQCFLRSKMRLGSSASYPPTATRSMFGHYLSQSAIINPMMHDWNTVYVRYCDGASFAGDAVQTFNGTTLHFRGKANRDETIKSLIQSEGMKAAAEVVIIGGSAGGLGIFLGIDAMADIIHREVGQTVVVRGLPDSGYFLKYTSNKPVQLTHLKEGRDEAFSNGLMDYKQSMQDLFHFANVSSGTNAECLAAQLRSRLPASNCIFAEHLLPVVKTPLFLVQPQFDSWQLQHVLGNYTERAVNRFGYMLVSEIRRTLHEGPPGHGMFIDSCAHHVTGCSNPAENTWSGKNVLSSENLTPASAFERWYGQSLGLNTTSIPTKVLGGINNATQGVNWFFQDAQYPCKHCCLCKLPKH
ncbi:Pectinacetylesterase-domain-containing protein [Ochromonadaceae sp. CCMP2298]|nr:Pectinacetylesterase-domain-containing protein [Ochromonadaceae sp. CCMP2298]